MSMDADSHSNFILRTDCPICTGPVRVVWHESVTDGWMGAFLTTRYKNQVSLADYKDIPYEIRHCSRCDFYFQTYVPTDEFLTRMYVVEGTEVSLLKKQNAGMNLFSSLAREAERIGILVPKKPHTIRVLEFGAGWGFWSRMAKAYGYQVHGVDTSSARVAYAKENGIAFYTSLAEVPRASFDVVFSDQVFEHITDPVAIFRAVSETLVQGGLFKIAVPNATGAQKLLAHSVGKPLKELQPFEHINGFTYHALVALADTAGLSVLPAGTIARRLVPHVRLTQNAHYIQEACKHYYSQRTGTSVYFIKQ